MKPLSTLDATFLRMESTRTPMHVGALLTFRLPADAPPELVQQLTDKLRERPYMPEPFGFRLPTPMLSRVTPACTEAAIDHDSHIPHSAVPHPGR